MLMKVNEQRESSAAVIFQQAGYVGNKLSPATRRNSAGTD